MQWSHTSSRQMLKQRHRIGKQRTASSQLIRVITFSLTWHYTFAIFGNVSYNQQTNNQCPIPLVGVERTLSIHPDFTRGFKQINQLDATISRVYYLTFMYSSTCFGRPHSHDQELNNCSSSLWFYRRNVVIAVLLVVVGPARPRPTALLPPRSNGKNQRLLLQLLSSWWWEWGRPKNVEL
jgi:hypothetical protein